MKTKIKILLGIFIISLLISLVCTTTALADTNSAEEPGSETLIEGDINGDSIVDENDVIYLLRYALMPEKYPVTQYTDVNGSDDTDIEDVIYLLNHTLKPEEYPIIGESHVHTLVHVDATEPDCYTYGNIEYWACTVCKNCYFDENGTEKATNADLTVEKLSHNVVIDEAVEPGIGTTGLTEGSHCSLCNQTLVEQEVIPALIGVIVKADSRITVEGLKSSYVPGEAVSLTATVAEGYTFDGWYVNDQKVSSELTYTFNMPDAVVEVKVGCVYAVNVAADTGLSVSGLESFYVSGEAVSLTAEIATGYEFYGWYVNGEKVSSELTYSFTMPEDNVNVEVRCNIIHYTVTVDAYTGLSISGLEESYVYNSEVSLTATVAEGYEFLGWYVNDQKVSSELTYTFNMPAADVEVEARCYKNFTLEVGVNSSEFGSATGPSIAYETQSVTVTATPAEGYNFFGWFHGDTLVSADAEYTFTMPSSDYELVARFTAHTEELGINIWDGSIATGFAKGSGTESDPYLISTGAELAYLASEINGNSSNTLYNKYYRLTNHIDLDGREWDPIGSYRYSYSSSSSDYLTFQGHFDGNGYTVYNFNITSPKSSYYRYFGLFGYIYGGTVKNLGIEEFTINLNISGDVYVGGLVGIQDDGTITNSYATGDVNATTNSSYSDAYAGGLVGYQSSGTIQNSYATGDVSATSDYSSSDAYAGGLVGYQSSGTIQNSYATGDVSATTNSSYSDADAGGLVGYSNGTITNSYATGDVSATTKSSSSSAYAGGLVGYLWNGTITNSYATGDVSATTNNNSYAAYAGGLVGCSYGTITNSYATGDVSATSNNYYAYAGGLVGRSYGTITNSYATGDVSANSDYSSSYAYAGGLVGRSDGTITNSYATGDVSATGYSSSYAYAGGLVGRSYVTITNCYRYDSQVIKRNNSISSSNTIGTVCTAEQLSSADFHTTTLGWDATIWKLDNLDLENGKAPTLALANTSAPAQENAYYQMFASATNGSVNITEGIVERKHAVKLIATPSTGYKFTGWYIGEELISSDAEFIYTPDKSCNIVAKFEMAKYTVTVDTDTGLSINGLEESYVYNSAVSLTATVAEGYTFDGWYIGDVLVSEELSYSFLMGTQNVTISARCQGNAYTVEYSEKSYGRIVFNSMGGSAVEDMTSSDAAYPVPTLDGYLFTGWYTDENLSQLYDFSGTLTERITLYAGWRSYSADGFIRVGETLTSIYGYSQYSASKKYYAFVPLVSETITIYSSNNSRNTYGYLYDANKQSLTSNDDGGNNYNFKITYTVEAGRLYYIAPCGRGSSSATMDLTVNGTGTPENNIDIGSIASETVEFGQNYTLSYLPKVGYDFVGYFTEANGSGVQLTDNEGSSIAPYNIVGDTTVYPFYTPSEYSLTLDYNDGATENSTFSVTYNADFRLPTPERYRYEFAGWYYGDTKIEDGVWSISDGDITLCARWTPILVTDVTLENDIAFDYESGSLELLPVISPSDAYCSKIEYSIISGAEKAGATMDGNVLNVTSPDEIIIRASVYGEDNLVVLYKDFTITAYTTHISDLEIVNKNKVVHAGETLQIELEAYPPTGYPRGEYQYQLNANTCGAEITADGVLSVTQPGKVRIRVRVDESEWSSWVWFYVPTPISTAEEFNNIRNDLSGYYILTDDIDLSGYPDWQPIGYAENSASGLTYDNAFKGYIDGAGHKITGLSIDVSKTEYSTVGLFGALDNSSVIKNLSVENYKIFGASHEAVVYVGGMAGILNGTVENGTVSGEFNIVGGEYIGGAVGQLFGEFENMEVEADMLIGSNTETTISVGGIVANYGNGTLSDCTVNASINVYGCYAFCVGGIAGNSDGYINNVTIEDAVINAMGADGTSYAGLYVGKTKYQILENITVNGSINAHSRAGTLYYGGVAGWAVDVKNCSVNGSVTGYFGEGDGLAVEAGGTLYHGRIVGYVNGNLSDIEYSSDNITVSAGQNLYYGGIAGYVNGNITNTSYSAVSVTLTSGGQLYYGGIAGKANDVTESSVTVESISATAGGVLYCGGIAGNAGNVYDVTAALNSVIAAARGDCYIGGIAGKANDTAESSVTVESMAATAGGVLYYGGVAGNVGNISEVSVDVDSAIVSGETVYYGSIAGKSKAITDCELLVVTSVTVEKSSTLYFGNIAGYVDGNISSVNIEMENAPVTATGTVYYGGLVGYITGSVSNSSFIGDITVNANSAYVGGVAGKVDGNVEASQHSGNITLNVSADLYAGGISGYVGGNVSDITYSSEDITVSVKGNLYYGGIAGYVKGNVDNVSYTGTSITLSSGRDLYFGGISGYCGNVSQATVAFDSILAVAGGQLYYGGIAGNAGNISDGSIEIDTAVISGGTVYYGSIAGKSKTITDCELLVVTSVNIEKASALYFGNVAGYIDGDISDMDVQIENGPVTVGGTAYYGGIVGQITGSVTNCSFVGNITVNANSAYVGGIAGSIGKNAEELQYQGDITVNVNQSVHIGGITGLASTVRNSQAYSIISVEQDAGEMYIGGIAGKTTGAMSDLYFFGYITANSTEISTNTYSLYIGGIAGYTEVSITESISNAIITTDNKGTKQLYVGGIAGRSSSKIELAKADGHITLSNEYTTYAGGIAGYSGEVVKSYSVGDIKTDVTKAYDLYIGGISGYQNGAISQCYYSFGDLFAMSCGKVYAGGISGYANGSITDSYSSYSYIVTDMSKSGTVAYLGGISGYNNGVMSYCYSMSFIEGKADGSDKTLYIGGLSGYNAGTINASYTESANYEYIRPEITIYDIETTALNSANVYAGGLVGHNQSTISNSYSNNDVLPRNSYAGGFVASNSGTVSYCISYSVISAALGEKVGGFAGIASSDAKFIDCYFSKSKVGSESAIGTGSAEGITAKTDAELRGVNIYSNYNSALWIIDIGKLPMLIFSDTVWAENESLGYRQLTGVLNPEDQHQYPIPEGYCEITFNVGDDAPPVDSIYVYTGESIFLITRAERTGFTFCGWYFDEEYTQPASEGIITFSSDTTLYAKWEAIEYSLTVDVSGKGETNITEMTYLYRDEITLTTDDVALDYVFIGWYEGETLLSADKSYAFSALPRDQHITARFLIYYDFSLDVNSSDFGSVTSDSESGRCAETVEYTATATAKEGYNFFGWFHGDTLISTDTEYTFTMPSSDYELVARFTAHTKELGINIWDGSIATGFAKGRGTESDPYLISTGAELAYLASVINGNSNNTLYNKYYRLTNHIDLDGREWDPIGSYYYSNSSSSSQYRTFQGHFDGNGYTVYNFKITSPKSSYYLYFGLFGFINGGTVKNLGVEDFTISLSRSSYAGGLVGYQSSGTIQSSYATGDVSATGYSSSYAGGLVGMQDGGTITNSYATGDVSATTNSSYSYAYAGGLVGMQDGGTITNSYATGDVSATTKSSSSSAYAGGLVGYLWNGTITNSYATGDVSANSDYSSSSAYAGGLVGYLWNGTITNSYATGDVSAIGYSSSKAYAGGLVGRSDVTITNCYRYDSQVIKRNNSISSSNTYGTVCTAEQLSSADFHTTTLGWDATVWKLGNIDFANGKLPILVINTDNFESDENQTEGFNHLTVGATYYQLYLNTSYINEATGTINVFEAIIRSGCSIKLIATPSTGYKFTGWYIGEELISSDAEFVYTPDKSCALIARFENIDYTVSAEPSYEGIGNVTVSEASYHYKDTVILSAESVEGYEFLGWYVDGEKRSDSLIYTFYMPAENLTVEAKYCKYFDLTVDVNEESFGSAEGTTGAYETQSVTVTATPAEGYNFFGWFHGDTLVSADAEYTFTMPSSDYELVARFTAHTKALGINIWDGSIATGFAKGSGTESDPYLISTGAELAYLASGINGNSNNTLYNKYYRLTNHIDLDGREWDPIGSYYYSYTNSTSDYLTFQGHFDGNGYTVYNFNITSPKFSYYRYFGLFGFINGGTVKNLGVEDFTISLSRSSYAYAGGLAGYISGSGTITNSYATGDVSATSDYSSSSSSSYAYAGGLVGYSNGTITNSYATGDVSATSNYYSSSSSYAYAGGLVGRQAGGTITNSYATGDVSANSDYSSSYAYAGGLVGRQDSGTITNSYATGDVSATKNSSSSYAYAGGLVGYQSGGTIQNSYATGDVSANSSSYSSSSSHAYAGGLAGYQSGGTIQNSYATGDVSANGYNAYAGGLAGYISGSGTITNSYATGDVSAIGYSSSKAYAGGLVGYWNNGTITNCYRYDIQVIKRNNSISSSNTIGTVCTAEQLSSADFHTTTLGWDATVWKLDNIDFANGKLPILVINTDDFESDENQTEGFNHLTVGATYYQLYLNTSYINEATGTINVFEAIIRSGYYIKLIAMPDEGYELVGWFIGGKLVSEDDVFYFIPTESTTVTAEFDLIRYTFITESKEEVTISDHDKRYYEGDEITVTATVAEGYAFDGWYVGNECVCENLTYTFSMPAETYILRAASSIIDYNLAVSENIPDGGTTNLDELVFNINNEITLEYTPAAGYRFLGWYSGDELLSADSVYTFTAPASDLSIEARCELIEYTLSVSGTIGGAISSTGGAKTVVDEVTLVATEESSYDFIGWYSGDTVYSYDKELTFMMPASDLTLEARFEQGYVDINVVAGFNGIVSGNTRQLKNTEITVTATPDEGYRLVGWYLNGELVSEDETYTELYDISGKYTLHAVFDILDIEVIYYVDSDEQWSERISDPENYLMPYAHRDGYSFGGWYLDNGTWEIPLTTDITSNSIAYAKWIIKETVIEMYRDLDVDYTFEIYTRLNSSSIDWNECISIHDVDGECIEFNVTNGDKAGHYIISADYQAGATYQVVINSADVFATNDLRSFALSFFRDDVVNVSYQSNTILVDAASIVSKKENNTGVVVNTQEEIQVGDIIYCVDDPEGCRGYVESVTLLPGGEYDVIFSSREITPEDVFTTIDVKQGDMDFDLADGIITGDVDDVMAAFAETAMEISTINLLMDDLAVFSAKNPTFVFDKEPTVKTETPVISGKLIEFKVTMTVNGKRQNAAGETLDEFAIRLVVIFRNEINTFCDLKISFPLKVKKFDLGITNTTTVEFNLDLVYGNKEAGNNFDALEMLLKDYETTISENKQPPFDVTSRHKETFEAFKIDHKIAIGSTGLFLKITVTPFMEYEVIGQVDINASFSVTNTCIVSYSKGNFDVYHNCETNRTIEVYALAYLHFEVGLDAELKLYLIGLEDRLNATVNLKIGPYVEASGALVYEQVNDEIKADLAGYVEWGYFYDWDVSIKLIFKDFSPNIDRVEKSLGNVGDYYLYFEFVTDTEEYVIEEYTVDIYDTFDHELSAFDLNNLIDLKLNADEDEYEYVLEDNPYIYINSLNQLKIKQVPVVPTSVNLHISIGNIAVKTVVITFNTKQYDVTIVNPAIGSLRADKPYEMVGETISFSYHVNEVEMASKSCYVAVKGWKINGEFINLPYNEISFEMVEGGLSVEVVPEILHNVIFVDSAEKLNSIRNNLRGTYVQTADIDMTGIDFNPIGVWPGIPFSGRFYGNGYSIKNLTITTNNAKTSSYCPPNDSSRENIALIGMFAATDGAILHSLTLVDASVNYDKKVASEENYIVFAAAITALSEDTGFYGCSVIDSKIYVKHHIEETFMGSATAQADIGSICGFAWGTTNVNNCYIKNITIEADLDGDGSIFGVDINKGENPLIGSLIGHLRDCFVITDNYLSGSIKANIEDENICSVIGYISDYEPYKDNIRKTGIICDVDIDGAENSYSSIWNSSDAFHEIMADPERQNAIHILKKDEEASGEGYGNLSYYYEDSIGNEDFLYDIAKFDPMLWEIVDSKIVKSMK